MSIDVKDVSRTLAEVSSLLEGEEDLKSTLERIVRLAQQVIHSCDGTGVTQVAEEGRVETAAATNPELTDVDARQYEIGSGPCLEAMVKREVVRIDDMSGDERWPEFTRHASEHDLRSLIAYPLVVRDRTLGALNLYSRESRGFADEDQELGVLFAAQAATALANAELYQGAKRLTSQLSEALESRAAIEMAKGVLIEREHCTADQAFEMLKTASQHLNRKVRDIAEDIVASAEMAPRRER